MGTKYFGTVDEINALNSYIKLIRAAESLNSRINTEINRNGLTESQFSILEALFHLGPLCQRQLGDKLLKSGGNITLVIDNLEKQNLVRRERGEKDRRFFTIHLTEKGMALIKKIFPAHVNLIVQEMNVLTNEEHITLQKMLKLIGLPKAEEKAEIISEDVF